MMTRHAADGNLHHQLSAGVSLPVDSCRLLSAMKPPIVCHAANSSSLLIPSCLATQFIRNGNYRGYRSWHTASKFASYNDRVIIGGITHIHISPLREQRNFPSSPSPPERWLISHLARYHAVDIDVFRYCFLLIRTIMTLYETNASVNTV